MMPNIKEAEEILKEAEKLNPGPWISHSKKVALAAKLIADKNKELNSEKAYVLGLLHDIGRRRYLKGMGHVLVGYDFMMKKRFEEAARICMTHTFPSKDIYAIYGQWDLEEGKIKLIEKYINNIEFDEYDLLIQLCDSIALSEGFTLMEKRFVQTALRIGINNLILNKWKAVIDIKKHFESKIGCSVYELLPGVVENTFENIN